MPFVSSIRSTFGAQSKQLRTPLYITVSPAIGGVSAFNLSSGSSITFTTEGEYTCTVPAGSTFRATMWGAGGGGAGSGWSSSWPGGSGGYATGLINLGGITTFKVIVGEGGYGPVTGPTGDGGFCTIGGGASSSPPPSGGDYQYSGGGGGFSGILTGSDTVHTTYVIENSNYKSATTQARSVLIAGGGGGGGNKADTGSQDFSGGHGGGSSGTGGYRQSSLITSTAGTQSSVGSIQSGSSWSPDPQTTFNNYGVPARMQAGPGTGGTYGGGGGGGYFGGTTSVDQPNGQMGGGGGGSGYFNPSFVTSAVLTAGTSQTAPGNNGSALYANPAGIGGSGNRSSSSGNRGNAGRVVISLS
jgi:hypothetical protein